MQINIKATDILKLEIELLKAKKILKDYEWELLKDGSYRIIGDINNAKIIQVSEVIGEVSVPYEKLKSLKGFPKKN